MWDSEKAKTNQAKHGVRFELAMTVISDPFALFEDAGVDEERREAAIGQDVMRRLLNVVHFAERDGGMYPTYLSQTSYKMGDELL